MSQTRFGTSSLLRAARAGSLLQEYLRGMLMDKRRPAAGRRRDRARAAARVNTTGVRVDAESILAARDADRR